MASSEAPCGDAPELSPSQRGQAAYESVQLGEVSRGRQKLVGASLAAGTESTFAKLQGKRPREVQRPLSEELLNFQPDEDLHIDRKIFISCLKDAPRGSSAGPGGMSYELLRTLLDCTEGLEGLIHAAELFARAAIPCEIAEVLMRAGMSAFRKKDDGVRGIAAGTTFRRLVAKTLARQYGPEMEEACAPFQFALSARAGID